MAEDRIFELNSRARALHRQIPSMEGQHRCLNTLTTLATGIAADLGYCILGYGSPTDHEILAYSLAAASATFGISWVAGKRIVGPIKDQLTQQESKLRMEVNRLLAAELAHNGEVKIPPSHLEYLKDQIGGEKGMIVLSALGSDRELTLAHLEREVCSLPKSTRIDLGSRDVSRIVNSLTIWDLATRSVYSSRSSPYSNKSPSDSYLTYKRSDLGRAVLRATYSQK